MMMKINYFTNQELHLDGDGKHNTNYECFGWWLPDLLSNVIHPPIGSTEILKSEEYDSGVSFEKSQLVSDESLTSGSQWDKTDINTNQEEAETGRLTQNQAFEKKNAIRNESTNGNIKISVILDKSLSKSNTTNEESGKVSEFENPDKSIISRGQLIALINSDLPNCEQLEEILQNISTSILQSATPLKTSTPSKSNRKRQKFGLCKKYREKVSKTELEELVLTAEHETTDRDLEEPRAMFLKAASGLDSRLTALQVDTQQMHDDLSNLQRDFQMQEDSVIRMTEEAHRLVSDLQNLRYLDDLIFLLQGQLDRITLQNWPFLMSHVLPQKDSTQELNLVV